MKRFFKYWLPAIIWAGMIFFFSSIADLESQLPDAMDLLLRKFAHMFEYAVLTILFIRLGESKRYEPWTVYLASLIGAILYAATDEWHQSFVPGRIGAITDIGIDATGAIIGSVFWVNIKPPTTNNKAETSIKAEEN